MIETKQIREWLQTTLVADGYDFAIFSDVAEFKKAYKPDDSNTITRYVNAIVEPQVPTILPIKNLQVATQSVVVHFVFDIEYLSKDANGNYVEVDNLKKILSDYISTYNGQPSSLQDDNGLTFEVTTQFNGITDGIAQQLSPIGNILPVDMSMTLTIVESGVNSNNVSIIFDGENLFYQSATINRTRMAETNSLASNTSTKTVMQSNGLSIHLAAPLLSSTQNTVILNDILNGGQNQAHLLEIKTPSTDNFYLCAIGNDNLSLEPAKNIGLTLDIVEIPSSVAVYPTGWVQSYVPGTKDLQWTISTTLTAGQTYFIVFDDTNEIYHVTNNTEQTATFSISDTNAVNYGTKRYYHSKKV